MGSGGKRMEKGDDPVCGTIIRRIIRGKERFYHQWREDGKTRSRYLRPDEILPLREKLDARRQSDQAIEQERTCARADGGATPSPPGCAAGVFTGKRLDELAASVWNKARLSHVERVRAFLLDERAEGGLLFIRGVKGSGKTTLLRQGLAELGAEARAKAVYMSLIASCEPADFIRDVGALQGAGYRFFFIDGLERSPQVVSVLATLKDTYCALGCRFAMAFAEPVLSLGLEHVSAYQNVRETVLREALRRSAVVTTTYQGLDDYRLMFDHEDIAAFVRSAGPDRTPFEPSVQTLLRRLNDRTLHRILEEDFASRRFHRTRLSNDIQRLTRLLATRLGEALSEREIEVLVDCGAVAVTEDEPYLILPKVRRQLTCETVRELLNDDSASHLGATERKMVEDLVLARMADRTLADLVLYEMTRRRANETTDVFRVRFPHGAFDVVVFDRAELTCELYEVRLEGERNDRQLANLTNSEMLDTVEHRYGTIIMRTLVYLGRDAWQTNGIAYRNAGKFLGVDGK